MAVTHSVYKPFLDALSGKMTRWMNTFFKMSGLTGWTEAHRVAYTYHLSNHLVGPVPSELTNLGVLTGQLARGEFGDAGETAVRFAMNNTPFVNLWYTRMAVDYLVNYHLREMMSPGTLARSERKMKEEMNQTSFNFGGLDLTPSHAIRKGGGGR